LRGIELRRIGIAICFILLVSILIGCGTAAIDTNNRIVAPDNNLTPIHGKWIVETCLTKEASNSVIRTDDWVGKTAEFSADTVMMGDIVSDDIRYKIKRVKAEEYLMHKFNGSVDKLGIVGNEVQIITISSEDKYLYEFIKVDDDRVIANIDNEFFCLRRVAEKVDKIVARQTVERDIDKVSRSEDENQPLRSGVLLGIRTPAKSSAANSPAGYSYRTLWIAFDKDKVRPVIEAEDLFLPRKSGFWKLMVSEKFQNKSKEDILTAVSIYKENSKKDIAGEVNSFWNDKDGTLRKAIENTGIGAYNDSKKSWLQNDLQVLPVDSLSNAQGVKISDIAGETGVMAMERAISNLVENYNDSKLKDLIKDTRAISFGLYRKTGHWFFKGRVGFQQKAQVPFIDFNINLIPSSDFVAYDILQVPWTVIKDRVPNAVDAFTSPNADIAVIFTKEHILIYRIIEEKLSETPLRKIELNKGDSAVMAEWASDYYVNKWESIFIKNNVIRQVK
jgi:hypothetical protein